MPFPSPHAGLGNLDCTTPLRLSTVRHDLLPRYERSLCSERITIRGKHILTVKVVSAYPQTFSVYLMSQSIPAHEPRLPLVVHTPGAGHNAHRPTDPDYLANYRRHFARSTAIGSPPDRHNERGMDKCTIGNSFLADRQKIHIRKAHLDKALEQGHQFFVFYHSPDGGFEQCEIRGHPNTLAKLMYLQCNTPSSLVCMI
ncbi:hypothetical protein KCV07_g167, partial [Aureobasidium melanogenum]